MFCNIYINDIPFHTFNLVKLYDEDLRLYSCCARKMLYKVENSNQSVIFQRETTLLPPPSFQRAITSLHCAFHIEVDSYLNFRLHNKLVINRAIFRFNLLFLVFSLPIDVCCSLLGVHQTRQPIYQYSISGRTYENTTTRLYRIPQRSEKSGNYTIFTQLRR